MSSPSTRSGSNLILALIAMSAAVISCTMCRGFGGNQASEKTRILSEAVPAGLEHAEEDSEIYLPSSFRIILPEPGQIQLGDADAQPSDLSALKTQLKEFLSTKTPDKRLVYLIASADIPSREVAAIMDELRNQDVSAVKLVASSRAPGEENGIFKEIPAPNKVLAVQPQHTVILGDPPNPLTLIVTASVGGMTLLNSEPQKDLDALTTRLSEIFKLRENNGVFREGTNEVEKTVIVGLSGMGLELKYGELLELINAVRGSGASPIVLGDEDIILQRPPRHDVRVTMPRSLPKDLPKIISGGVLNGKAISLPKPPYPAAARAVNATGAVTVQVTVDTDGKVIEAAAVSGHPLLRPVAVIAARSAEFAPTLLAGKPVKVKGILTYNFVP